MEGTGTVEVQVARDRGFRKVVARDLIKTTDAGAHYAKARVAGLKPYEEYYYRFATRDEQSPVGRFRTALPPDSNAPVRFAFFSCQDFTFGYFNAHALLAKEDLDFVVCLGDYIYAEDYYPVGPTGGVRDDTVGTAETLEQYRSKYLLYRTDANLRRVHARFPMINIWDDHEVQDNYAGGGPVTGGLDPSLHYSDARKRAGYQAFFESLPTYGAKRGESERIYRAAPLRAQRGPRPMRLADVPGRPALRRSRGWSRLPGARAAAEVPRAQPDEVRQEAPGVLQGRVEGRGESADDHADVLPRRRHHQLRLVDGLSDRAQELVGHIKSKKIKDVVFITGDIHTFVAGDVRLNDDDKRALATEFVGGSVSAPGLGEGGGGVLPGADPNNPKTPEGIINALKVTNPWVKGGEFDHHGYGLAVASKKDFRCTLKRVATVRKPGATRLPTGEFHYRVRRGHPSILYGRRPARRRIKKADRAPVVEARPRACPPNIGSGQAGPRRTDGIA